MPEKLPPAGTDKKGGYAYKENKERDSIKCFGVL